MLVADTFPAQVQKVSYAKKKQKARKIARKAPVGAAAAGLFAGRRAAKKSKDTIAA